MAFLDFPNDTKRKQHVPPAITSSLINTTCTNLSLSFLHYHLSTVKNKAHTKTILITGSETVCLRRGDDSSKIKIYLSQLNKGKFNLKRRAVWGLHFIFGLVICIVI